MCQGERQDGAEHRGVQAFEVWLEGRGARNKVRKIGLKVGINWKAPCALPEFGLEPVGNGQSPSRGS